MTITTTLHFYRFDIGTASGAAEYRALCDRLQADPGRAPMFRVLADTRDRSNARTEPESVTLDTGFVFSNQWNEIDGPDRKGRRIFDWYEGIVPNRHLRAGHYLVITDEMRAIRATQHICGDCGARSDRPAVLFCDRCLDSPYLKATELHLTRLLPVGHDGPRSVRPELTETERAERLPLYIARQTSGADSRAVQAIARDRARVLAKFDDYMAKIELARTERDGMIWLLDHGVPIDNVIFYTHTGRFAFGWKAPIDPAVRSTMVDVLCEFPFDYDFDEPRTYTAAPSNTGRDRSGRFSGRR
jgi:hypothetical protein